MKLYVAGWFKDYRFIREVIDQLKARGHTITHDWTRCEAFDEAGELIHTEEVSPREVLCQRAEEDLKGVADAEAVVLCYDKNLCGALIEVGAALAARPRKQIFIVHLRGQCALRWTIFFNLPEVHFFYQWNYFFLYMEREARSGTH
jgi:hypothetical protein